MIKKIFILVTLFLLAILTNATTATAQENWVIENFDAKITIEEEGFISVSETIQVDFGDLKKHGIFRDIPRKYTSDDDQELYIDIRNVSVYDQEGKPYQFTIDSEYPIYRIKIGSPNFTISGKNTYIINYESVGNLRSFGDTDELYLDIIGNDWPVPILKSSASITLYDYENIDPDSILKINEIGCWAGPFGGTNECDKKVAYSNIANFAHESTLNPRESFTIGVAYTGGIIPAPIVENPSLALMTLFYIIAGVALLTYLFGFIIWYKNGRDYKYDRRSLKEKETKEDFVPLFHYEPITVEYESPQDLPPGILGVVIDEKVDGSDISSTIVDLAVRGYIKIEEIENKILKIFTNKDYKIIRLDKDDSDLLDYEKRVLEFLFIKDGETEIMLSELKQPSSVRAKKLETIKNGLYKEVTKQKMFKKNPKHARAKYIGFATAAIVTTYIVSFFTFAINGIFFAISIGVLIAAIIFIITFAQKMPQKTAAGREIYVKALGYREFVKGTEKYRAKFLEDENMFIKVLPYAMVFGVAKKYIKAMEKIGVDVAAATNTGIVASSNDNFVSSIGNLTSSIGSTFSGSGFSSGSGGGGGFSGGGGGGGGGGSW